MTELKGFTPPLSATGRSSLVPTPPWHYSGEMMTLEYRTDPDRVIELLPDELEPAEDPGAVALVFADWQTCRDDRQEEERNNQRSDTHIYSDQKPRDLSV